jgi:hypothetical protein
VQEVLRKENERLIKELETRLVEVSERVDLGAAPAGADEAAVKAKMTADITRLAKRMTTAANDFLSSQNRPPLRETDALVASIAGTEGMTRGRMLDLVSDAVEAILKVEPPQMKGKAVAYADMTPRQQADHRQALSAALNAYLKKEGRPEIQLGQPLLAHPNLDMFVSPESAHPMKSMGCTVCHEGSGQETDFIFAAHTPKTHAEEKEWEEKYYMKEWGVPQATFHLVQEFWERPMLLPYYTSASCAKCHHQIMDLERLTVTMSRGSAIRARSGRTCCTWERNCRRGSFSAGWNIPTTSGHPRGCRTFSIRRTI